VSRKIANQIVNNQPEIDMRLSGPTYHMVFCSLGKNHESGLICLAWNDLLIESRHVGITPGGPKSEKK